MEQKHIVALAQMTNDQRDTLHTRFLDRTLRMGTPAMTPVRFFWLAETESKVRMWRM